MTRDTADERVATGRGGGLGLGTLHNGAYGAIVAVPQEPDGGNLVAVASARNRHTLEEITRTATLDTAFGDHGMLALTVPGGLTGT